MHFHIIENTPGYMPDTDEPYIVETAEDAKIAIAEIVEEWRDNEAETAEDGTEDATIGIAEDGLSAWITDRPGYIYDLGRVAVAIACSESDCETED